MSWTKRGATELGIMVVDYIFVLEVDKNKRRSVSVSVLSDGVLSLQKHCKITWKDKKISITAGIFIKPFPHKNYKNGNLLRFIFYDTYLSS